MVDFLSFHADVSAPVDPDMPQREPDLMLNEGSLMLIDPAHSEDPWAAGVPGAGAVKNIALAKAQALIGSGDASTLGAAWTYDVAITGDVGLIERTAKGGLHVICSQSAFPGYSAKFTLPTLIKQYLADHPTHEYYIDMWHRPTRQALNASLTANVRPPKFLLQSTTTPVNNHLAYLNNAGFYPAGSKLIGRELTPGPDDLSNCFAAIAVNGWTGTPAANAAALVAEIGWGGLTAYASASWYALYGSHVLYRWYLEDLTVSGLSFSERRDRSMRAWNYAMTQGRYSDDSYTDPTTIP